MGVGPVALAAAFACAQPPALAQSPASVAPPTDARPTSLGAPPSAESDDRRLASSAEPEERHLASSDSGALQPVVIGADGGWAERWRSPASLDVVGGDELRADQLQLNLSEVLARVPGLVIRNRNNYAQDLQVSIRGFGARAPFGVRGLRLYVDGIPASAPDGQGQAGSFPLGAAQRVEVLRGPFALLYGASAGGVLAMYTEDGRDPPLWRSGAVVGSDGLWRLSTQYLGRTAATGQPGWSYALDLNAFGTDGMRPQSSATRGGLNLKLVREGERDRVVLQFAHQSLHAQDPQGLTRQEFDANPYATSRTALLFDTRKRVTQTQAGVAWQHDLGAGHRLELMGYGGERDVLQYLGLPVASQASPASAGGVVDLGRLYWGLNARWRLQRDFGDARLSVAAGLARDAQRDARRGYENFDGALLGVRGRLRRDERNRAQTLDPYLTAEWSGPRWGLSGGLRHSRVRLSSQDAYVAPGNPDDSGSVTYRGLSSAVGARWSISSALQLVGSVGRGFETPTLNEAAYRADGRGGFNSALQDSPAISAEIGLRGRHGQGEWSATAFDVRTDREITVLRNTGGRASYGNAGRTRRQGLELAAASQWGELLLTGAFTWMNARYADGFLACGSGTCLVPSVPVPASNRLPGLPRQQLFAQAQWMPRSMAGHTFTAEVRHSGRLAVDDLNSAFAPSATIVSLAARRGFERGAWRADVFARIDNVADRRHVGSVIVNEGNGRFYEPGAGRAFFVGLELSQRGPSR